MANVPAHPSASFVNLYYLDAYALAASGSFLTYDYLCTFQQEVQYVWSAGISIGTVLFYINRYLPFADTFIFISIVGGGLSPKACNLLVKCATWMIVAGSLVAETILALRTSALWNRKRSITISLFSILIILTGVAIAVTYLELKSVHYVEPTDGTQNCTIAGSPSRIIFVAWVSLALSETIIFILTVIRAAQHLRQSSARWLKRLYQDGLLFYIYLLGLSFANILVPALGPPQVSNLMATPQRVIHSLLCNRVMFFILSRRHTATGDPNSLVFTSIMTLTSGGNTSSGSGSRALMTSTADFYYEDAEGWWGRVEENGEDTGRGHADGGGSSSRGGGDGGGYHSSRNGSDLDGIPLRNLGSRTLE